MSTISLKVREVIEELDADGGGFRTREAADLLVHRVTSGPLLDDEGKLVAPIQQLVRLGASKAISDYKVPIQALARQMAEQVQQGDFAEITDGWDLWIQQHTAMDETADAERKKPIRCTLPEIKRIIALCERKSREAGEKAAKLRRIVLDHPEWEEMPSMILAEVLGAKEA